MISWSLASSLIALLLITQALLWLAARGLSLRLPRAVMLAGLLLPFLLLAPWLNSHHLLVPTGALPTPGGPALPGVDPHRNLNDAVFQFLPWELEVRHALSDLRLPLWSDLLDGGSSPWANPQAAVLSPIAMLARPLPIQYFLLVTLALKVLVAFSGAWLLARRLGASRAAAMLAGIGFAVGGSLAAWSLFPHTQAVAWVPWVTVGAVGLLRRPTPLATATTALLTAGLLLSGHPETALGGGLFAAALALGLRRRRLPWRKGFTAAALAAALGFGLAAPILVPFALAVPTTQRARDTQAHDSLAGEVRWGEPDSWFFEQRGRLWFSPVAPLAFGTPYKEEFSGAISWPDSLTAYAGLVALAGALIALVLRRRSALLLWLLLGLFLLLASHPLALMRLLFELPVLKMPAYSRLLLTVPLALAVAGALGWTWLLRRFAAGPRRWVLAALAVVALVDLVPWARAQFPRGEPAMFYPTTAVVERLRNELSAEGGPWRMVGEDRLAYPGSLSVQGLADPRPHNPMAPAAQIATLGAAFDFAPDLVRYFAPFHRPDQPLLDFLNVRVVLGSQFRPPLAVGSFERVEAPELAPYQLWRNPDALPRWFLTEDVVTVPAAEVATASARVTRGRQVVLAREEVGEWKPAPAGAAPVTASSPAPGNIHLSFSPGEGERLLATSLPSPNGWRANAGDQTLRRVTVNGGYTGVVVPAGVGGLEMRFRPRGGSGGWGLMFLGVVGGGIVGWKGVDFRSI